MSKIELDYPNSLNSLYNIGKYGQLYKTDEGKAYIQKAGFLIRNKIKDDCFDRENRCAITVKVWFPDNRVRDPDNLWKLILDAIDTSGVIKDDCWQVVSDEHISAMGIDRNNPRIIVEIKPSDKEVIEID